MEPHRPGVLTGEMDDRERDLADVTALADRSLRRAGRAGVERRVASSQDLTALLERQSRALESVHGAAAPAPPSLRGSVGARPAPRRRGLGPVLVLGAAAAAAIVALVLPGGSLEPPSIAEAAALSGREPASGPPRPLPAIEGVRFPRPGAIGVRFDRLGDRRATTVYYRYEGDRIGYTIVAGPALAEPTGWRPASRAGTRMRVA